MPVNSRPAEESVGLSYFCCWWFNKVYILESAVGYNLQRKRWKCFDVDVYLPEIAFNTVFPAVFSHFVAALTTL